jgi:hypothetical protein
LLFIVAASPTIALAQSTAIDRVEEDWELVIGEPDPNVEAPQVINILSPNGTTYGNYFLLELNHGTQPEYILGGRQLQHWFGESFRSQVTASAPGVLCIADEPIRYTLALSVNDGVMKCEVRNGQSVSWGEFGGTSSDRLTTSTGLNSLNWYRTETSLSGAKIGFGSFRVSRFRLVEVRKYSDNQLVSRDTTSHVVFERSQISE